MGVTGFVNVKSSYIFYPEQNAKYPIKYAKNPVLGKLSKSWFYWKEITFIQMVYIDTSVPGCKIVKSV